MQSLLEDDRIVCTDLGGYRATLERIETTGMTHRTLPDAALKSVARVLKSRVRAGAPCDELLGEAFSLVREAADRVLGMRPFDVQVLAGIGLHDRRLVEMQTGEGKTLAAVLPVFLNALSGHGVHVLTFNDYLARRDADWMGPLYRWLGLNVRAVQEGMTLDERRAAYAADVTYATAKEAGFDYLRLQLCRDRNERAQRPFHYAVVDEADSILIDEARVPLVIAGRRPESRVDPYRLAEIVRRLEHGRDFDMDGNRRSIFLTETGLNGLERSLGRGGLHDENNLQLLTEIHQALHARVLLRRDVDYIVREGRIEIVDELTGRVVDDRRWPDGLQAALEAKEGLAIRPGGRILGSIALQHFLGLYPGLAGMTATARSAAEELTELYGLTVAVIPPHRPCVREDLPDVIFTHERAKQRTVVAEIQRAHRIARPVLIGTASVAESEALALALARAGLPCRVLNAKNDEQEAGIVARAGAPGAVTISTNMAGRGTDIRLGGADGRDREEVVKLGGLYVIGTHRHESRRIDDQLRGRAGRQGDPGTSRFFISLEDDLMTRFDLDAWIPAKHRPAPQDRPIEVRAVRRGIERLQRSIESQNFAIRRTLWRYSALVEKQRAGLQQRRMELLLGSSVPGLCAERSSRRHAELVARWGEARVREIERRITLAHLDRGWEEHLDRVAGLREGIHLVRIGGLRPLEEFARAVVRDFDELQEDIDRHIVESFERVVPADDGIDLDREGLRGPASTWTYLVDDRGPAGLHEMLAGSYIIDPVSALITGPLVGLATMWRKRRSRRRPHGATGRRTGG